MTRSIFKDSKYFENYIEQNELLFKKSEDQIKSLNNNAQFLKRANGDYLLNNLIASYSWNKSIQTLDNLYSELIDYISLNWDNSLLIRVGRENNIINELLPDIHYSILEILSIGVLLGDKSIEFKKMKLWLESLNIQNNFFDILIKYELKEHTISPNSNCPKYLNKFEELTEKKGVVSKDLIKFHKKWYGSLHQKNYGWKDNHLNENKVFKGYWNFGIAALAKVYEFDISVLYNNIFFPTDLYKKSSLIHKYKTTPELELILEIDKIVYDCKLASRISSKLRTLRNNIFKENKPTIEAVKNEVYQFKKLVLERNSRYRILPWKKSKLNKLDDLVSIIQTKSA